jgi:hypothetical protein
MSAEARGAGSSVTPPPRAYKTEEAVFWLELSDVTKRFARIYTCKSGSDTPEVIRMGRRLAGLRD